MSVTELLLQRQPTEVDTTFGDLYFKSAFECFTLEDAIREIPGRPVHEWKIKNQTAIPAGRYRITLENSPKFGPDTITLNNVDGFDKIRMHGGNDVDDTEGCPVVGNAIDRATRRISGAVNGGVLARLKQKIKAEIEAGTEVWITVANP